MQISIRKSIRVYAILCIVLIIINSTSCSKRTDPQYTEMAISIFPDILDELELLRNGEAAIEKVSISSISSLGIKKYDLPVTEVEAVEQIFDKALDAGFSNTLIEYTHETGTRIAFVDIYSHGVTFYWDDDSNRHVGIYYFEDGQQPNGYYEELEDGYWLVWGKSHR